MVAAAAVASPAPSTIRHRHHPPYKEMILRAIGSLKEAKGSSRTAISKFIAANYSDLPPAHDALLSTHIGRLKKNGLIRMVKHSYKLASDPAGALDPTSKPRGRPPKSRAAPISLTGKNPDPTLLIPKKRGRPRKNAVPSVLPRVVKAGGDPIPPTERRRPGRPRKTPPVALTEMRKAGRPRKVPGSSPSRTSTTARATPVAATPPTGRRKRGRPYKVSRAPAASDPGANIPSAMLFLPKDLKRKPGRPKKSSSSPGLKRKPGRPKKVSSSPGLNPMVAAVNASVEKRKPGRPRKVYSSFPSAKAVDANAASQSPLQQSLGKVVGEMEPGLDGVHGVVKASAEKRKPGRPKKVSSPPSSVIVIDGNSTSLNAMQPTPGKAVGEVNTSVEKRKPGRPKKVPPSTSSVSAVDGNVTSPNPVELPPEKAVEQVELGLDPMPAATTSSIEKMKACQPRKVLPPSSALVGDGRIILLNSVLSSLGKTVGVVMPARKRCGGPPKRSNIFGSASMEGKMVAEEKRKKRPVGRPRKW